MPGFDRRCDADHPCGLSGVLDPCGAPVYTHAHPEPKMAGESDLTLRLRETNLGQRLPKDADAHEAVLCGGLVPAQVW